MEALPRDGEFLWAAVRRGQDGEELAAAMATAGRSGDRLGREQQQVLVYVCKCFMLMLQK
jgi:hypothetical protein